MQMTVFCKLLFIFWCIYYDCIFLYNMLYVIFNHILSIKLFQYYVRVLLARGGNTESLTVREITPMNLRTTITKLADVWFLRSVTTLYVVSFKIFWYIKQKIVLKKCRTCEDFNVVTLFHDRFIFLQWKFGNQVYIPW